MPATALDGPVLAAWLQQQGWRILSLRPAHCTAERRVPGTPHDWYTVLLMRGDTAEQWHARLYRKTPQPPTRDFAEPYHYYRLGAAEGLTTEAELGLFLGGLVSRGPHGDQAA